MRAAFMTDVNAVQRRRRGGAEARPARRHPEGRGVRHLRDRRADVLQRRPEGARPVGAGSRARGHARRGGSRGRPAAGRRRGRSCLPGLDPHVRRVPVVHGGIPEPVRGPSAVRVRPVPRRLRRLRRGTADRHEEPDPAAARPAVGPGHGRRSVRVRAERDRAARHPARRHRDDPGHRSDRMLAGRHGARPRCEPRVDDRRQPRSPRYRARRRRQVHRRRVGRGRGQRRRGRVVAHGRRRRGTGERRCAGEAGAAGRARDGRQAREGRVLRRAAEARPGQPARYEPAPLQGARRSWARTAPRTGSTASRWTT